MRPGLAGSPHHARWQWWESQEQATTLQSIFLKSFMCSLKAIISVGHTKVLQRGATVEHYSVVSVWVQAIRLSSSKKRSLDLDSQI